MNYKRRWASFILLSWASCIIGGCVFSSESTPTEDVARAKQVVQQTVKEAKETVQTGVQSGKDVLDELSQKRFQQAVKAMERGDYQEAIAEANRVLVEHPRNADALSLKGMNLALAGDWEKGLQAALESHDINPDNVKNFYDLAIIYKLGDRLDESKAWFEKVLEKDPKHLWSTYGVATIYADQGQDEEALRWLEKAIQIDATIKDIAKEQDHFERFRSLEVFQQLVK